MTASRTPVFFYGTLRYRPLLEAVLGRTLREGDVRDAFAAGYRTVPYPGGRIYPALVREAGRAASGVLVSGLGARDAAVLDAFEGEEYRRGALLVASGGAAIAAEAYWPTAPIPAAAPDWDFAAWVAQHSAAVLVEDGAVAAAIRSQLAPAPAEGEPR